jgi:hypothetical protein
MGLSLRLLVVDKADHIYQLHVSRFDQMRDDPKTHRLPQFAGERARSAEAVVELLRRKPVHIIRMTFSILTFDQKGCLDREAYERHQFGRFVSGASPLDQISRSTGTTTGVLNARYLFDDRGGRWAPSATLLRAIQDAALGNVTVPRL